MKQNHSLEVAISHEEGAVVVYIIKWYGKI